MESKNTNTILTKDEIRKKQQSLSVLRADLNDLSDDKQDLHLDLFNKKFLRKYTSRYESFTNFIEDSPSKIRAEKLRNAEEIDNFVKKETVFETWNNMKEKAIEEWIANNATLD